MELGTKGYWAPYFALRAAPLGQVPPELVTALFYNFHPGLVARAVPAVWELAAPSRFLEVRLATVDAALRRLLGIDLIDSPARAEATSIARAAALAAPTAGRALAAADAALPWPDAPHLVLRHAQTVLREHRGDDHVAALLTAGVDPVETLVLFAADRAIDGAWLRKRRGWSDEEWAPAVQRLAGRGLLRVTAEEPVLSPAGVALRDEVEVRTVTLTDVPWTAVGDAGAERPVELVSPLVAAIVADQAGGLLPTNPMGLRPLVPTG